MKPKCMGRSSSIDVVSRCKPGHPTPHSYDARFWFDSAHEAHTLH